MKKLRGSLNVLKTADGMWDVVILAELPVLKAFTTVYPSVFFIEKSIFEDQPAVIVPDFGAKIHANTWAEYWRLVFEDPNSACKTCSTVTRFLEAVETERVRLGK